MRVRIVGAQDRWATEFAELSSRLHEAVGDDARRIDHIGSTAVPGLPSKDVIDIQITVRDEETLRRAASILESQGWRRGRDYSDHPVPGLPEDASQWRKEFFDEPEELRRTHVHMRIEGRANQRYALLFRDYLRTHPAAADAYAEVKRGLARLAPDSASYADAKDPACDLIYHAAEAWAREANQVL